MSNLYHNLVNYVMESFLAGTVSESLETIFALHGAKYNQCMVNMAADEAENTLRDAGAIR